MLRVLIGSIRHHRACVTRRILPEHASILHAGPITRKLYDSRCQFEVAAILLPLLQETGDMLPVYLPYAAGVLVLNDAAANAMAQFLAILTSSVIMWT